jgi:hypothetical protein
LIIGMPAMRVLAISSNTVSSLLTIAFIHLTP